MFERGIMQHMNLTMHQPIVRIPLVIFEPGRNQRTDIYEPTSAVDLLPTLLSMNEYPLPDWLQGDILPPYRSAPCLRTAAYTAGEFGRGSAEGEFGLEAA